MANHDCTLAVLDCFQDDGPAATGRELHCVMAGGDLLPTYAQFFRVELLGVEWVFEMPHLLGLC